MYSIINYSEHDAGIKEIIVDFIAELASLPGAMGSMALCLEDTGFYVKNGEGEWIKVV